MHTALASRSARVRVVPPASALVLALAAVAAWSLVAAWVGYRAVDPSWARDSLLTASPGTTVGFATILGTNLAAALLLFSGAGTAGLGTLLATTWTGGYVGATLAVGVENAGAGPLLGRVWPYLPLELGALLLAAVAGAYPLVATLLRPPGSPDRAVTRYVRASRTSLLLVLAAALGLVAAAAVETAVLR